MTSGCCGFRSPAGDLLFQPASQELRKHVNFLVGRQSALDLQPCKLRSVGSLKFSCDIDKSELRESAIYNRVHYDSYTKHSPVVRSTPVLHPRP